jgi:hypothetical protein
MLTTLDLGYNQIGSTGTVIDDQCCIDITKSPGLVLENLAGKIQENPSRN